MSAPQYEVGKWYRYRGTYWLVVLENSRDNFIRCHVDNGQPWRHASGGAAPYYMVLHDEPPRHVLLSYMKWLTKP